jgi:hypothetical protein
MAVNTQSYVDIGAVQRKEGGSPTVLVSYVDIGAAQRQEAAATTAVPFNNLLLMGV